MDEMVELLCANLQKDELAALNTSMSAEGLSQKQQQDMVKVRSSAKSPCFLCLQPLLTCAIIALLNMPRERFGLQVRDKPIKGYGMRW